MGSLVTVGAAVGIQLRVRKRDILVGQKDKRKTDLQVLLYRLEWQARIRRLDHNRPPHTL